MTKSQAVFSKSYSQAVNKRGPPIVRMDLNKRGPPMRAVYLFWPIIWTYSLFEPIHYLKLFTI
jgi:hypothetical protein